MRSIRQFIASAPWLVLVAIVCAPMGLLQVLTGLSQFVGHERVRGQIVGRDFMNYWSSAHLLLGGRAAEVFDPDTYNRALGQLWGAGLEQRSFAYPPSLLPLIAWCGALPYGVALLVWSALGAAALLVASWPHSRRPLVAVLILLSPAVLICLDDGQNGLFTAALLIGGLRLVDRRPWLAGVLIGLVSFKPQLGLLVPLALIASGRWRTIAGAAVSTIGLAALSVLIVGTRAWTLYLDRTVPYQKALLERGHGLWLAMTPSPLVAARAAGLPVLAGDAVQLGFVIVCAGAIVLHFHRLRVQGRPIASLDILLLVTAGFLAAPYSFNYDMACVVLALVMTAAEHPEFDTRVGWRWGSASLWAAPFIMMFVGSMAMVVDIPWPPVATLMVAGGLALIWRDCGVSRGEQPTAPLFLRDVSFKLPARRRRS